ncbi:MAG: OmpA family protein [Rhodospirillales bacterium]
MSLRSTLLAATMVALPLVANAAPVDGLYVGLGAGINIMQNEKITANTQSGSISSKIGPAVVLGLGYGFGNGFRAEIEGNFRSNDAKSVSGITGVTGVTGTEQKYGAMVNALYDFDGVPVVTPYVGVGVGYQAANWQGFSFANGGTATGVSGTKGSFAYQGIAGAALPIDGVPGLSLTAEYRFMGLAGNRGYSAPGVNINSTDNYNHSVLLGVRYAFGAPAAPMAPPAVPAKAAEMARKYLVFFDWDKANLSDRAKGTIKDAAANSVKVAYTKIDIDGNADTSGTPAYNKGLSMRRAQAVAAELVKDGVPKAAIAITASGDTHLLVPTGAGVREPQNRRVEINIR